MRLRRSLDLLVLLLMVTFVGAATPADGEDGLAVIGPHELAIPAESATISRVQLPDIAVRYEPVDAAWTTSLRAISVVQGGNAVDPAAFGFTLVSDEAGEPVLRVTVDVRWAREAGTYAVTVQATHQGAGAPEPQLLEFTFTRPAAKLRTGTPIRIERVIPFFGRPGPLAPLELLLEEVGGRAGFVTAQPDWLAELRGAESRPVAGRLRVTFPGAIDAWGQGSAGLAIEGALPLGTVTGTVTIRSHQFADRALDVAVEVASRLDRLWLVVSIVVGIVLGLAARVYLERRRERTIARIAAEEQRGRLRGLIDETVDPDLGDELRKLLKDLGAAITAPGSGVASLQEAAKATEEGIDRELKAAAQKRTDLGKRIADVRVWLGSPVGQPHEIASFLETSLQRIVDREHELTQGWIRPVEAFLDVEQRDLPARLTQTVVVWLNETAKGIALMQPWPGTALEEAAQGIRSEIAAIRDQAGQLAFPEPIKGLLNRTRTLADRVRHELLDIGLSAVDDLADDVLKRLEAEATKGSILEPSLATLREHLAAFEGVRREEPELARLAEAVHALRASVAAALSAAVPVPAVGRDDAVREGLREGDFARALEAVIALRATPFERALGTRGTEAAAEQPSLLRPGRVLQARVTEGGAPAWALRIGATPSLARVGEPINLHADIVVPHGDPVPVVSITWEVGGQPTAAGAPGYLDHQVTPRRSGPLVVRATATDPATGTRAAAETTLQVHPAEGFAAVRALSNALTWTEALQTTISGILIASAGYAIFERAFIGTYGDILAALLWGFSVDVGVARVREMAAPLLARTVPVPAPSA